MVERRPGHAEGSRIVSQHLKAEELGKLTVQAALEQALIVASDSERATLLQIQGIILLLPNVASQPVQTLLVAQPASGKAL